MQVDAVCGDAGGSPALSLHLRCIMGSSPFPEIPLDILRIIIEISARLDRHTSVQLALVNKSIQTWWDLTICSQDDCGFTPLT